LILPTASSSLLSVKK